MDAAQRGANARLSHLREDGFLPGQITIDGDTAASYCCLTGNCQFSIIWAKFFDRTSNEKFRGGVIRALDYVMQCQDIHTTNPDIRSAIKGSQQIGGKKASLSFHNVTAKFFLDAILLRIRWLLWTEFGFVLCTVVHQV